MASLTAGRPPVQLVPLVGRQRELQDVMDTLARSRLVTLTGPGGTGKTRLALAAADAARAAFADGVCWVELAPIDDPEVVALEVASCLGAGEDPSRDVTETIAEHVGDRSMLIVLDNCEHLAAPAAELAHRVLGACPALSILATSREALGVDGERQLAVPPLALPQAGPVPALSALAEFDAVRFFEQRAQLVRPTFRLAGDNAAAVLSVCRRLDGLPLAIELAAARMRILSVVQLADRLDDIFTVLVGGVRTAPRRHQTLRATLDWSHDLLAEDERAAFRRLAVFAGGFTLAAAEEVTVGDGIRPDQVIDLLARLADKSLLWADHNGADVRYHLLATVRDYARECLVAAAEEESARRAHMRFFAGFVEQIEPRISGSDDQGSVDLEQELKRIEAETANLRAALEFARTSGDVHAVLRIAGPLERYAYLRGQYSEVRHWMDSAVTIGPEAPAVLLAKALLGSGRLALLQCDYAPASRRLEAALRLYRELDDAQGIARALQALGSVAREQGRYARAMELHGESLAVAQAAGDRWAAASAHGYLGFASWLQRDFERATAECTTALEESQKLGDVEGMAWSMISLGVIARYQGAAERAAALLEESRSLSDRIGFREGIAWSLEQLGLLAVDRGDPAAEGLLRRSLELHRDLRDQWRACSVLEDLATLALARGLPEHAAGLMAAAEEMRGAIGTVVAPCESALHAATLDGTRAALGGGAFEAAWRHGRQASMDELLAELPRADSTAAAGPAAGQAPPAAAGPAADQAPPAAAGPAAGQAPPAAAGPAADQAPPAPPAAVPAPRQKAARPASQRASSAGESEGGDTGGTGSADTGLRIRALGAATVHRGDVPLTAADWGYGKPRELLFLLATSPPMTREQLGAALWPDQARQRLGNALHTALRELRRALGDPGWVLYVDGRYAFNGTRRHDCDVETFEQALAAARRVRPAAAALPDLQRAIAAYGGDFLGDIAVGEWAQARRDELRRAFEAALLAMGRLHAAAGRYQPAVTAFRRAVAHEPLNETAHRELMSSWARMGETARAVRHYRELEELLREQVGVPPAAETTALYRRLLDER
jgi:predicted ATPase/DNA-binding SARP family transcriptional activator